MNHQKTRLKRNGMMIGFVMGLTSLLSQSVFAEDLYIGTQGGPWGTGAVYRYASGAEWINLSEGVDLGNAVMDIEPYRGTLYVATQTESGYGGWGGKGQVWRYDGNMAWTQVGEMGSSCTALVVLNNQLYVVVTDMGSGPIGRLYRYEDIPGKWTLVGSHSYNENGAYCWGFSRAIVSNLRGQDEIYIGDLDKDSFYRYNPAEGLRMVDENWRSCVYSLAEYKGHLFSGCWHGAFYQSTDGNDFVQKVYLSNYNHIWATAVFQDRLYAGTGNGGYGSTYPGELRVWDGASLPVVKTWPTSNYAEGVTTLASDGNVLYIGLGVPTGYYTGDSSMAEVWTYDGSNFSRISAPDAFGGGVQSMAILGPMTPSLELTDFSSKPNRVEECGQILITAQAKGSWVRTDETSLKVDLPAGGWSLQSLHGPTNGNGTFSAVIVLSHYVSPNVYPLRAYLVGKDLDGTPITSNMVFFNVEVVSAMSEEEHQAYDTLQEGILQMRAWDLNMESPLISASIPSAIDLTSAGVASREDNKEIMGILGETYRYWYQFTCNGTSYGPYTEYWSWPDITSWPGRQKGHYTSEFNTPTQSTRYDEDYDWESRTYFMFHRSALPPTMLAIKGATLSFSSGYTWPEGTYYFNINDLKESSFSAESTLFDDAGDGTLMFSVPVSQNTVKTLDVKSIFPLSEDFHTGLDVLEESSPVYAAAYSYAGIYSGGTYTYSHKYTYTYAELSDPMLTLSYLRGYSAEEIREMMLASVRLGDGTQATTVGTYANDAFGRTADEWRIRPLCCAHTSTRRYVPCASEYVVIAKNVLTIDGNTDIQGNVHSDTDMVISGNVAISGQADAINNITLNGTPSIGVVAYVTTPIFPNQSQVLSQVGGYKTISGSIKISNDRQALDYQGVYFVNGDVEITGNLTVNATFIATGNIKVAGGVVVNGGSGGYALYTEKGLIEVTGSSAVKGKVVGYDVKLPGTVRISGDPSAQCRINLDVTPSNRLSGETVNVSWEGLDDPSSGDWVGLYIPGSSHHSYRTWRHVPGQTTGSIPFELPVMLPAGTYEFRLFSNSSYRCRAISNIISVESLHLNVGPAKVAAGGTLTVTWSGVGAPTNMDWIGVYVPGTNHTSCRAWSYTTGQSSGTVSIQLPVHLPAGLFEVRLYHNDSYHCRAISNTIQVEISSLSVGPEAVDTGGTLTVTWSGLGAPTTTDWIGLYAPGTDHTACRVWIYTGGQSSGSIPLRLPVNLPGGLYEARLFSNDSYTCVAGSNTIRVGSLNLSAGPEAVDAGGMLTVTWSGLGGPTRCDWIGLYSRGTGHTAYLAWSYTGGESSGSIPLRLPTNLPGGLYEVRFFTNDSYTCLTGSNTITVR